jgi:Ca-activated chloride channel family protein
MVEPGPFRLSYLLEGAGLSATVLAHPDDSGVGGTFLLLGGLSLSALPGERPPREVTVVIDRSGSMRGEKLDQAREAALQVIEGLELGEWFHIVDYSDDVASFEPRPVQKTAETLAAAREYLASLRALGGTNIAGALELALSPVPSPGAVSVVLFLTDGLPTIGATDERDVRARVQRANAHGRRIFTFGVGYDVNAPLLDHVARASRATSHYVHPHQDLELAVAKVFRGLSGPVLSRPRLVALDGDGMPLARAVRDVLPGDLPDVFEGDQLVVLGRYEGARPIALFVEGDYLGRPRSFRVELDPARASRANAFVPRLWAARKIASLVDAIREAGAATGNAATDPRTRELVEEIVHLSTRYGVLSEYTAFLALEPDSAPAELVALGYAGDDFFLGTGEGGVSGRVLDRAEASLAPAATERAGAKAVRQAESLGEELDRRVVNRTNSFRDKDGNEVRVSAVQQVQDRTFYRRASGWVDGELLASRADFGIDSEVEFASDEYFAIAAQLAREGRQAALALGGDVLLTVGGKRVLLRAASPPTSGAR